MIVESKKMRRLLNTAVVSAQTKSETESWREPSHYRTSMNPMPALIFGLLGKMMSSHHQDSMVSTMIHGQWGDYVHSICACPRFDLYPPLSLTTHIVSSFPPAHGAHHVFLPHSRGPYARLEQQGYRLQLSRAIISMPCLSSQSRSD